MLSSSGSVILMLSICNLQHPIKFNSMDFKNQLANSEEGNSKDMEHYTSCSNIYEIFTFSSLILCYSLLCVQIIDSPDRC